MAYTVKNDNIVPSGLADRWELLVEEAAKRLKHKRDEIRKTIGPRPYRGLPVNDTELRSRWFEIRKNPEALFDVFSENVRFTKEGKALLPKELVNKIYEFEQGYKSSGEIDV